MLSIALPLLSQLGKADKSATHQHGFHFSINQQEFCLPFPIFFLFLFAPRSFLPLSFTFYQMDEKERHVTLVFITKILPVITIRYKVWLFSFESKMSVLQYGDLFFGKKEKKSMMPRRLYSLIHNSYKWVCNF